MDAEGMGRRIAAIRKEKDLTQRELAETLHVTDKAISKWERGAGCPDIATLPVLADALGITVTELLTGRVEQDEEAYETGVRYALGSVHAALEGDARRRRGRALSILWMVCLAAMVVCLGSNRRISGGFTWSAYPVMGLLYAALSVTPLLLPKGARPGLALGIFSGLLLPVLWFVLWRAGAADSFVRLALPIALAGLVYLWGILALTQRAGGGSVLSGLLTCAMVPVLDMMIGWAATGASRAPYRVDFTMIGVMLFSAVMLLWLRWSEVKFAPN